jgi:REP element-mobilizing transposase RayT
MSGPSAGLDVVKRLCVEQSISETCAAVGWTLHAVNARTNHVHVVVTGPERPERILTTLKAWCTRRLRRMELIENDERVWSRHGSTVYLWTELDVEAACTYVLDAQDDKSS